MLQLYPKCIDPIHVPVGVFNRSVESAPSNEFDASKQKLAKCSRNRIYSDVQIVGVSEGIWIHERYPSRMYAHF